MRKPFYKKQTGRWYVEINRRQIPLGSDESKAYAKWQRMVQAAQDLTDDDVSFLAVANAFLGAIEGTVSQGRFGQYASYIAVFCKKFGSTPAKSLNKGDVTRWLSTQKQWSDWGKRDCVDTVLRVLRWACTDRDILKANPLRGIRKPAPKSRSRLISPGEHELLVRASLAQKTNGRAFALYLIASRCGARPQDIRSVTAANVVKIGGGCIWSFTEHKTAHVKGERRIVYLTPCLATLTGMLIERYPAGPLFRQEDGRAWSRHTLARRFNRLREKLKLDESIKIYSYRHTYATEALVNGASMAEAAELLGHTDTRMVSRTYGHLDQHSAHMIEKAAGVYRKRPPE